MERASNVRTSMPSSNRNVRTVTVNGGRKFGLRARPVGKRNMIRKVVEIKRQQFRRLGKKKDGGRNGY
eukprot:scaffold22574_cov125-Cylindrotheca_fusiformis.AAC.10